MLVRYKILFVLCISIVFAPAWVAGADSGGHKIPEVEMFIPSSPTNAHSGDEVIAYQCVDKKKCWKLVKDNQHASDDSPVQIDEVGIGTQLKWIAGFTFPGTVKNEFGMLVYEPGHIIASSVSRTNGTSIREKLAKWATDNLITNGVQNTSATFKVGETSLPKEVFAVQVEERGGEIKNIKSNFAKLIETDENYESVVRLAKNSSNKNVYYSNYNFGVTTAQPYKIFRVSGKGENDLFLKLHELPGR